MVRKFPLSNLYLYVTERCNLRCQHCWVSAGSDQSQANGEVSIKEYEQLIDQALDLGLRHVKLTGGEPLLRNDIGRLLEFLSEKSLSIAIETNGTLITSEIATLLQKVKASVAVSLDAANPDVHDQLRGVNGSHDRTLTGIRMLIDQGMRFGVIMALYRPNLSQIEPLLNLCRELGVARLKMNPILAMGRGEKLNTEQLLSTKQLINLQREVERDLKSRYSPVSVYLDTPCSFASLAAIRRDRGITACPFMYLLGVLSNGDISFCGWGYSDPTWIMGNIRDIDLKWFWENHPLLKEARAKIPSALEGVCDRCVVKSHCQGKCRAHALSVYGSLTAPDPQCQSLYERGLFPSTRLL